MTTEQTSAAPAPVLAYVHWIGKSPTEEKLLRETLRLNGKRTGESRLRDLSPDRRCEFYQQKKAPTGYQRRHGYFAGWDNIVVIHSKVTIESAGAVLHVEFGPDVNRQIVAPREYIWDCDNDGVKLVRRLRPSEDYHPTIADLIDSGTPSETVRYLVRKLRENARARRESDRREKLAARTAKLTAARQRKEERENAKTLKIAQKLGIFVCFRDSLKSGNCVAGTMGFVHRHGFDPNTHLPIETLEKMSAQEPRLAYALREARNRAVREIRQGFCLLADHRISS